MTRDELVSFFEERTGEMVRVMKAKNADYAGKGEDPFANFTMVEKLGICKTEQGFLTRMTDKLGRIASFVQAGTLQVKSESVQDTLLDLANYSLLMAAYIESKASAKLSQIPLYTNESIPKGEVYLSFKGEPLGKVSSLEIDYSTSCEACKHEGAREFNALDCKYYCQQCGEELS